jgi:hypothetical protein
VKTERFEYSLITEAQKQQFTCVGQTATILGPADNAHFGIKTGRIAKWAIGISASNGTTMNTAVMVVILAAVLRETCGVSRKLAVETLELFWSRQSVPKGSVACFKTLPLNSSRTRHTQLIPSHAIF